MKKKKLVTILLVLGSFMAVAGTSSANVISFSGNVSFDHDQVVSTIIFNESSLDYTFLSDTVSLSQFDPGLGILKSVELTVESTIDVETHYWYDWDTAYATMWWYSNVIGSVNGLQATFFQEENVHTIGQGYHDHVFTMDGTASDSTSTGLAGFIGTGLVDVDITGDDKLCAWWNHYDHIDTDTYGTVTATLIYNYALLVNIDIKPGSDPNPINPGSNGLVPVAILSSPEFDATQVDPTSVSLAGASVAVRGKDKSMAHEEDVNGDGLIDLVVQVETQSFDDLGTGGTIELTGTTFGGENIVGYDEVVIVPPDQ